jgi:hypothetical protein
MCCAGARRRPDPESRQSRPRPGALGAVHAVDVLKAQITLDGGGQACGHDSHGIHQRGAGRDDAHAHLVAHGQRRIGVGLQRAAVGAGLENEMQGIEIAPGVEPSKLPCFCWVVTIDMIGS